jgi:hypothetical protein
LGFCSSWKNWWVAAGCSLPDGLTSTVSP